MASFAVRYTSVFQLKVVKLIYLLNSFLFFAILSRLLLLINLIGLFQYISNGIHDFYFKSVLFIISSEIVLSALGLIPISVPKLVFKRSLDLYLIYLFQTQYNELTKNQIYSIYLMSFSAFELLEYINYYYGLFKIRKSKTLKIMNMLFLGTFKACLEFLIIFKSLSYVQKGNWEYWFNCIILLGFIPVKYVITKRSLSESSAVKVKSQ